MQKILIFTDGFLPKFKGGGPITSISNLVNLLNKNFNILICTRNHDFGESELYKDIVYDKITRYQEYNVVIGDNFHSGSECLIITSNHNYEGEAIPYDDTNICKDVCIEDNVWLGSRVIILGGVTIGEGAIIQAESVVVKSIPKYAIAGGHPAKVFAERNIEHYEKLKLLGKY